jgi:hypothetical protein
MDSKFAQFLGSLPKETLPEPVGEEVKSEPENQSTISAPAQLKRGRDPGKRSNPEYTQMSAYILKTLHHKLKVALVQQNIEISELIERLVGDWVEEQERNE